MSYINPIVLLEDAVNANTHRIVEGLVVSITLFAGNFVLIQVL